MVYGPYRGPLGSLFKYQIRDMEVDMEVFEVITEATLLSETGASRHKGEYVKSWAGHESRYMC